MGKCTGNGGCRHCDEGLILIDRELFRGALMHSGAAEGKKVQRDAGWILTRHF